MSEQQLRDLIDKYNKSQWLWAWLAWGGALLLWPFSYGLALLIGAMIEHSVAREAFGWISHAVAAALVIVLIVYGYRRGKALFDVDEYTES